MGPLYCGISRWFGQIFGVNYFGPIGVGCFGPISKLGCYGPVLGLRISYYTTIHIINESFVESLNQCHNDSIGLSGILLYLLR